MTDNDKICPWAPYGAHIMLHCYHHPHLSWSTKNIAPIGARTLFFTHGQEPECSCRTDELFHTCPDCEEYHTRKE